MKTPLDFTWKDDEIEEHEKISELQAWQGL
jgi:hypothetical protein